MFPALIILRIKNLEPGAELTISTINPSMLQIFSQNTSTLSWRSPGCFINHHFSY